MTAKTWLWSYFRGHIGEPRVKIPMVVETWLWLRFRGHIGKPRVEIPGMAVETWLWLRFHSYIGEPRIENRHVASSHLLEAPFAYIKPCRDLKRKQIEK